MEGEGIYEQIHAHFIVRRKVYGRCIAGAHVLHGYLVTLKLNLIAFGFVDDEVAKVFIRGR